MTRPYQIRSVVICDDIRREANKKEILIGVYADGVVLHQFPGSLLSLHFRLELKLTQPEGSHIFSFSVKKPSGRTFLEVSDKELQRPLQNTQSAVAVLDLAIQNPLFDEVGIYQLHFKLGGSNRKIGEFDVRGPAAVSAGIQGYPRPKLVTHPDGNE